MSGFPGCYVRKLLLFRVWKKSTKCTSAVRDRMIQDDYVCGIVRVRKNLLHRVQKRDPWPNRNSRRSVIDDWLRLYPWHDPTYRVRSTNGCRQFEFPEVNCIVCSGIARGY